MGACTAFVFAALIEFTVVSILSFSSYNFMQYLTLSTYTFHWVYSGQYSQLSSSSYNILQCLVTLFIEFTLVSILSFSSYNILHYLVFFSFSQYLTTPNFTSVFLGELPLPEGLSFWVCSQFVNHVWKLRSAGTTKRACKAFTKGQKQRLVFFQSRIRFFSGISCIFIQIQINFTQNGGKKGAENGRAAEVKENRTQS